MLAILHAFEKWHHYLYGSKIKIKIDPLTQPNLSMKKKRWLATIHNALLWCKNRIYLVPNSKHKLLVLQEMHSSPMVGHVGVTKTYEKIKESFIWDGLWQDVVKFVIECLPCQQNKVDNRLPAGLCSHCPFQKASGLT